MTDSNNKELLQGEGRWRRYARNRYVWLGLAVLVLAAAGGWAWKIWRAPLDELEKYQVGSVLRGDIEDLVTATGTMQPRDYVDVGAQVSGQLKKIHVEVGSVVEAGDLLGEIDPTVFRANVDARRALIKNQTATMSDRESQLALAELQFTRQKNLIAGDATTQEAYQAAEAALRSAKAQLAASRASLEQTESTLRADEANLNYAKIYAPISGVVVSITAKQGQTLNANQQAPIILRIADLSTMTVQTQVSEADVSRLRSGMEVYFTTLGNRNRRWYGSLRKVEPTPTVTNNVVLFNALFDVANTQRNLLPQMTAQVFFVASAAKDVLYVPAGAVTIMRRGPGEGGKDRRKDADDAKPSDAGGAAEPKKDVTPEDKVSSAGRDAPAESKAGKDGGSDRSKDGNKDGSKEGKRERGVAPDGAQSASRPERAASAPQVANVAAPATLPRPAGVPDFSNLSPEDRRAAFEKLTPEQREAMREWRRANREQNGGAGNGMNGGAGMQAPQGGSGAGPIPRDSTRTRASQENKGGAKQESKNSEGKSIDAPKDKLPSATVWAGVGGQVNRGAREATVKVVKADNSIEERKIQVGITNRIYVQIISGLEEGDKVITGLKPPPGAARAQQQSQQGQQRNALQGGQQGVPGMGAGAGGGAGNQGARAR